MIHIESPNLHYLKLKSIYVKSILGVSLTQFYINKRLELYYETNTNYLNVKYLRIIF